MRRCNPYPFRSPSAACASMARPGNCMDCLRSAFGVLARKLEECEEVVEGGRESSQP